MNVLIKGMMMPINCQTCPFVKDVKHAATPEYEVVFDLRCGLTQMLADNLAFERNKDCPLVEIPPHGRLIDADALEEYCEREAGDKWSQKAGTLWSYAFEEFKDIVYNRETIIEAEGVK